MNITSHFIGISLDSSVFVDLFVELQKYVKKNNIEGAIELQNPLSVHITLCYLDDSEGLYSKLKEEINKLNDFYGDIQIKIKGFDIFKRDGLNYIYYLYPFKQQALVDINHKLKQSYPNEIVDNNYPFNPHMTLFKIRKYQTYVSHKESIEAVIRRYLKIIQEKNVFKRFNLYAVNSEFSPQIQITIY